MRVRLTYMYCPGVRHWMSRESTNRTAQLHLFAAGMLAALLMTAFMLLLRTITETSSLLELVAATLLRAMPMAVFSFFLRWLHELAKPILVVSVVIGFLLVGGGIARLDGGPSKAPTRARRWRRASVLVLSLWIPSAIAAVIATTYFTAVPLSGSSLISLTLILLADIVVYAIALYGLYPLVVMLFTRVDIDTPPADLGRRRLVSGSVVVGVALLSAGYIGRFVHGIHGGAVGGGRNEISPP